MVMKDLKWEQIDDNHQRSKIHGGWLVKTYTDVYISLHEAEPPQQGYEWRVAICFVPDPNHEWSFEQEFECISSGVYEYESTMKCIECNFVYQHRTEMANQINKERSEHKCEAYQS